jgi:hypothetical protein
VHREWLCTSTTSKVINKFYHWQIKVKKYLVLAAADKARDKTADKAG